MSGEHDFYVESRRRQRVEEEMRRLEERISSQREELLRKQDSKVKQIRNEYENKLNRQNEKFENELKHVNIEFDAKVRKQNSDFKNMLSEQRKDLEQIIKKESSELNNKIDILADKINRKKQSEKEKAAEWLENLARYMENLKEYDCNKFCPEKYKRLENQQKIANNDFRDEVFQSTISIAQDGCLEAAQLLENVKLLTAEWEFVYSKTMSGLEVLQEFIKTSEKYELEMESTGSGKKEFTKIDIEYWSGGELKKIKNEIKKRADILKDASKLTLKNIISINDEISEIKIKVNDLFEKSISNYMNHIIRQEIQEVIAEKLEKSGFFVTSNFWEEEDERKQNILILKNAEKEQIFVGLEYDNKAEKIQFHWKTDMKNKHDREERAKAIIDSINDELGFAISEKEVKAKREDKPADAEHFDEKKYRKKTSAI